MEHWLSVNSQEATGLGVQEAILNGRTEWNLQWSIIENGSPFHWKVEQSIPLHGTHRSFSFQMLTQTIVQKDGFCFLLRGNFKGHEHK